LAMVSEVIRLSLAALKTLEVDMMRKRHYQAEDESKSFDRQKYGEGEALTIPVRIYSHLIFIAATFSPIDFSVNSAFLLLKLLQPSGPQTGFSFYQVFPLVMLFSE